MSFINGLSLVEEILFILGVILFIVSVVKLLTHKTGPLTSTVILILISIVLMAWTTGVAIKVNIATGEVELNTCKLQQNPHDTKAKAVIQKNIGKIESRGDRDPKIQMIIENARIAICDTNGLNTKFRRSNILINKRPVLADSTITH
jgi:hypothetical protein